MSSHKPVPKSLFEDVAELRRQCSELESSLEPGDAGRQRLVEINEALIAVSVRQDEMIAERRRSRKDAETLATALKESDEKLRAADKKRLANAEESRRAALNLMEDAVLASRTIEESERKYRTLFESIDEGFCLAEVLFDEAGEPVDLKLLDYNPVFERHAGMSGLRGKTARCVLPVFEQHWLEAFGRVALTGKPERIEEHAAASGRYYSVHASRVGENGSRQVVLIFDDVTRRRRREAKLSFLADTAKDLARLTAADEIIEAAGRRLSDHLELSTCLFVEIDEAAGEANVTEGCRAAGLPEIAGIYSISQFLSDEIVKELRVGKAVTVEDTHADPRVDAESHAALHAGAFVMAPFHRGGLWKFLVVAASSVPRRWHEDETEAVCELSERLFPRLERARAEQALRESEQRSRSLTENLPGGAAFIVDRNLRYTLAQGEAMKGSGMRPEDLLGKSIFEVVPPDEAAEYEKNYRNALNGEPFVHEHSVNGRDFISRGTPLRNGNGEIHSVLAVSYDITDRKRAEEAVRRSEEQYRTLFESIDEGFCVIEVLFDESGKAHDYRFLQCNNAFVRQTGIENAEGRTIRELKPKHEDFWFETYGKVAVTRESVRLESYAAELGRWYEAYAYPVEEPELHRVGVLFNDITGRKMAEEELRKAHDELEVRVEHRTQELADTNVALRAEVKERKALAKSRTELLQKVVTAQEEERRRIARDLHDQLGQRLTALRLKMAALRSDDMSESDLVERMEKLQEIAEQLDAEVGFLAGRLRPSVLDDLGLGEALKAYAQEWSAHFGIPLYYHTNLGKNDRLPGESETHLYRIAQEALNNTAKYAEAAEVVVTLEKAADGVILVVGDDGVGFDTTEKAHHEQGRGFGLVGMSERADLIGARLQIESEPGGGTTVIVKARPLEAVRAAQ